jgi:hypothetical protein
MPEPGPFEAVVEVFVALAHLLVERDLELVQDPVGAMAAWPCSS